MANVIKFHFVPRDVFVVRFLLLPVNIYMQQQQHEAQPLQIKRINSALYFYLYFR